MISSDYFWKIVLLLGAGTFTIRYSIIALTSKVQISSRVRDTFTFIPAAILPALITPMVFFHQGTVPWAMGKERFVILVAATVVSYVTRSTLATILFGLLTLYFVTQ